MLRQKRSPDFNGDMRGISGHRLMRFLLPVFVLLLCGGCRPSENMTLPDPPQKMTRAAETQASEEEKAQTTGEEETKEWENADILGNGVLSFWSGGTISSGEASAEETTEAGNPVLPEETSNSEEVPPETLLPVAPTQSDIPVNENPDQPEGPVEPVPVPETTPEQTTEEITQAPVPQSRAAELACSVYTSQMLIVEAEGSVCEISLHERNAEGYWEEIFCVPGFVGTGGVGYTDEWNGGTPNGVFSPGIIFGNAPDPGCPLGYLQTDDTYYWVDDVDSVYYNQLVSTSWDYIDGTEWNSAEHIASAGPCYDYIMDIGYNPDCIPGAGSAIFVHVTTGFPSRGCVGVPREEMITILQRARSDMLIVIGNREGAYAVSDY